MKSLEQIISEGWDINITRQKKRSNGQFVMLLQYRAKKAGTLKEYTNDCVGYVHVSNLVEDLNNNLPL